MPSRGDDEAVGGVGMKRTWQSNAIYGDGRLNRCEVKPRQSQRTIDPSPDIIAERQTSFLHKHRDFPRRNRRNQNPAFLRYLINDAPGLRPQAWIVLHRPDQDMGIDDDQRMASQSSGSAAGDSGSS